MLLSFKLLLNCSLAVKVAPEISLNFLSTVVLFKEFDLRLLGWLRHLNFTLLTFGDRTAARKAGYTLPTLRMLGD